MYVSSLSIALMHFGLTKIGFLEKKIFCKLSPNLIAFHPTEQSLDVPKISLLWHDIQCNLDVKM